MSNRYFVVSDIHGYYTQLQRALDNSGFNPQQDTLVVAGDIFDRGEESPLVFGYLKELHSKGKLILVRGNHEDLLKDCITELLNGCIPGEHHFSNGTVDTIGQFCGKDNLKELLWKGDKMSKECRQNILKTPMEVLEWIDKVAVNYTLINDKFIVVHGWLPITTPFNSTKLDHVSKSMWKTYRWENGMEQWSLGRYYKDMTVICGHWHCSWGWSHLKMDRKEFPNKGRPNWKHSFEPFVEEGIVAIDACTAYSDIVNVVVIKENEIEIKPHS